MKKIALILAVGIGNFAFSQYDSFKFKVNEPSESNVLLVGYQFAPEAKDNTETFKSSKLHIVELAYSKVKDKGGRHPASTNIYYGTDLIFNYSKFLVAPKLGINLSANALSLGSEFKLQTDFEKISPILMPYLGIGFNGFKLFMGYSIRFIKIDQLPINTLNLGITVPLYNFSNKSFLQ